MSLAGTGNNATAAKSPFGCFESSGSGSRYGCSSNGTSTHLCIKCDFYCDSLLSHESEESEGISDSKPYRSCSSENPSTPPSIKCDSSSVISDLDKGSYWDSSLNLEVEVCEWISESAPELEGFWDGFHKSSWGIEVLPSAVSAVSSLNGVHCNRSQDNNTSVEHLLEIADMQVFSADGDGPLFWPFEGKLKWNSEESWSSFCVSPRRSLLDTEDCASKEDIPFSLEREEFCLVQEPEIPIETLVGLKEFDGHEGLDSEFNGDVFMLDESLLIIQAHDSVVSKPVEEQN